MYANACIAVLVGILVPQSFRVMDFVTPRFTQARNGAASEIDSRSTVTSSGNRGEACPTRTVVRTLIHMRNRFKNIFR